MFHEFETVARAIENVYHTFASSPRPTTLEACRCCVDDASTDRILAMPVWEIPGEDVSRLVSAVPHTSGTPAAFQYLLPRILELLAQRVVLTRGPVEVADQILWAGFHQWSPAQKEVVILFYEALFDAALRSFAPGELARVLQALAVLGRPVSDSLQKLEQFPSQVRNYFAVEGQNLREGRASTWRRDSLTESREMVVTWLESKAVQRILESWDGLLEDPDSEFSESR